ncbi:hypothetical protein [Alistipes finegoldii]|uniref:hypothetical protein n=1 Tax=Alistipes finegoldii TaxID=214856 RepID=UPI0024B25595|nr:hypothetical protein [Alistipes finegoldii]
MDTLDYNRYDVVGIVTKMGATQNAQIIGVGLSDRETGAFIPIQSVDRNKMFPTRGCVFAFEFLKYNPLWENECVCLCVKPNNNPNIVNGEDYVWDWKDEAYIYADKVRKLNVHIGEDGGENYDNLLKEGLMPCEKTTYFICAGTIYRLDPEVRLLPFWKLSDVTSSLIAYNGNTYVIDDITIPEAGKIDITSDIQLIEWYKKNVLRKEWNTIYETKGFTAVDALVTTELQKLRIPTNVYQSRLARIMRLSANISLTFEELEDLASAPWFADTILNTMNIFAEQYIEKVKNEHRDEISALESKHKQILTDLDTKLSQEKETLQQQIEEKQKELKTIDENIQEKKRELNALNNDIEDKNKVIKELDSRKESIVADFSVIKEVLSTGTPAVAQTTKPKNHHSVTDFDMKNEREFSTSGPYKKNIDSLLMKYKARKVPADEIVTQIATYNVVLFPDDETLLATMQATRRCRYVVSYVGVDWKSFNDFWDAGLSTIIDEAINNPDIIHFLVLRNINMSFIPCYLQPILDMERGLAKYFPRTTIEFPDNMKILCTRAKDTVIPITESSLEGIGCIAKYEERHTGSGNIAEGYLPVSVFSDLPINERYYETDACDSYTDE